MLNTIKVYRQILKERGGGTDLNLTACAQEYTINPDLH